MALVQTAFIWVSYAVAVALIAFLASVFTYIYQTPRDRSVLVTTVTIFTLTSLLATVFLLPVDIALVSSTSYSRTGTKKDWATPEAVSHILLTLKIVYYTLYSLDALLCLIVVPFTYFWYEDYDEVDELEGNASTGTRFWSAFKYTTIFIALTLIVFLIGFFAPIAALKDGPIDLPYFRDLLTENHGERALTFALGLLTALGTVLYIVYTAPGLALLPIKLIKSAPSLSAPALYETTASALASNRERQRQLEAKSLGPNGLTSKDQRELQSLVREERTLVRRERLAAEAQGENRTRIVRAWTRTCAVFRPLKLLGGLLLLLTAVIIFVSMLITCIDKVLHSTCKNKCGYIVSRLHVFQPINAIFVFTSTYFPIDYALMALLVLLFFTASVTGIASIGVRFLWVRIFRIRKGRTSPQGLLMATIMLSLIVLAINYALVAIAAPQYATFGPQTFCAAASDPSGVPDCSTRPDLIRRCSSLGDAEKSGGICTPSVVSTFLNRIVVNFPFYGAWFFWAQFVFLGVFLIVFVTALFGTPKLDLETVDEDAEADEEEGLLASTGRRFGAAWGDAMGGRGYGSRGDHVEG